MTVLKELLFSLVYYPAVNKFIVERNYKVMRHFLKGTAAVAVVLIVSMAIHVFCNVKGIQLDQVATSVVSAGCAVALYQLLTRNEQKKGGQE